MSLTILLLDDDAIQAATRKAILSHSGHEVIVARDAQEALKWLEDLDFAKRLSLVITDHLMPRMNGPEFVNELRRRFPTLPVLVLSGFPGSEEEYRDLCVIYRLKPIAPEELIELTRSISRDMLGRTA
jgi:CheY-like chemotaxis protein